MTEYVSVFAPLVAGLVPLDNLPGWPAAPDVPLVHELVWILFIPAAVAFVVALIGLVRAMGKEDASLHPPTEPVVVTDGEGSPTPAVTAGGEQTAGPTQDGSAAAPTGGASARW